MTTLNVHVIIWLICGRFISNAKQDFLAKTQQSIHRRIARREFMNTWEEECVLILTHLGGHAYLHEIYETFLQIHTRNITKGYEASIRGALERGSSESKKSKGKPLFYMVDGKYKGHYGLLTQRENLSQSESDDEFSEGNEFLKLHLSRERNSHLIKKAKQKFEEKHAGKLYCEVCGFNFENTYGHLGKGFIEAHHTKPISEMLPNEKTRIDDIVMLCSNCHSMIHRHKPWLKKEDIRKILK